MRPNVSRVVPPSAFTILSREVCRLEHSSPRFIMVSHRWGTECLALGALRPGLGLMSPQSPRELRSLEVVLMQLDHTSP